MVDKTMENIKIGKGIPPLPEDDCFESGNECMSTGLMVTLWILLSMIGSIITLTLTGIILWGLNWIMDAVMEISKKL